MIASSCISTQNQVDDSLKKARWRGIFGLENVEVIDDFYQISLIQIIYNYQNIQYPMRLKILFYLILSTSVLLIISCRDIEESNVVEEGNYKYFIGSKVSFTGTRGGGEFFLCESGLANCECSIDLDQVGYLPSSIKFQLSGSYSEPVKYNIYLGNRTTLSGNNGSNPNFQNSSLAFTNIESYFSIYLEDKNERSVFIQCKNRDQGDKIYLIKN